MEAVPNAQFAAGEWQEIASEWDFLRAQPDHDADEMSGVHSAPAEYAAGDWPTPELPPHTPPPPRLEDDETIIRADAPLSVDVTLGARTFSCEVGETALIGRVDEELGIYPEIDLSGDDGVSRRHARFYHRDGIYFIQDLNSLNGTCLNGRWLDPIKGVPLHADDEIEIAETVLIRVRASAAAVVLPQRKPETPAELTAEDVTIRKLLAAATGGPGQSAEDRGSFQAPGYAPPGQTPGEPGCDLLDTALLCGERAGLYVPEPAGRRGGADAEFAPRRSFADEYE